MTPALAEQLERLADEVHNVRNACGYNFESADELRHVVDDLACVVADLIAALRAGVTEG